ncbi:2-phosphosulfolactate phosphatase [Alteribacillus iranensis]|uniref:Probable 2-phosphosulfolactate phosphatase n=1 Tax=Alteribacillus iranensis TaxID=930128 RepID=A0A1I2BD39_9BACI|nr:2-phosphosulfolactate phosphatase [Alteribacillus iranensis]SFE54074.1 Phosphosulfolactate phosphohydrolase [Alteribacillus iranensis]
MDSITFEVAFTPNDIKNNNISQVCVLVDALRATTAMITMLDKGCNEIILTDEIYPEINNHVSNVETLYCAEDKSGNIAESAHFGPSLHSLERVDVRDKNVILRTTNGTHAAITLWNKGIENILVGSLRNAKTVMEKAVAIAEENGYGVTIVCAGREKGNITALDDVYTAGVLVEYGKQITINKNRKVTFKDSAKICRKIAGNHSTAIEAFEESDSGETMRKINCQEDIELGTRKNISTISPLISFTEQGELSIKNNEVKMNEQLEI